MSEFIRFCFKRVVALMGLVLFVLTYAINFVKGLLIKELDDRE